MDLKTFKFPVITNVDMVFSTIKTNYLLLAEAKRRGFYNSRTKYNDLFSSLFYSGGSVVFKKGVDQSFKDNAWAYCKAFMRSFEPKHEEKEAVCAMIMSEILEPKIINNESK